MRRAAIALIPLLSSLLGCGGGGRATIGVPEPQGSAQGAGGAADEPADAGAPDAAASAAPAPPAEPRPDPATIKLALDRTAQAASIESAPYGLRFEVVEQGPELPWALAIVNRGSERVRLSFDPRLLRLSIQPPTPPEEPVVKGKPKPKKKPVPKKIDCALPEGIRPAKADKKLLVDLEPGEGMVESFDPRLYCLPKDGKSPLEPGAVVSARYGWPLKTKAVWRKGKKEEERLPQTQPFVAMPTATAEELAKAPPPPSPPPKPKPKKKGEPVELPPEPGVKELAGADFTLGGEYGAKPPEADPLPPLEVRFARGSDAQSEETATVTVEVRNRSRETQRVFFRRELVSFDLSGPDGMTTCDPQPDTRAPDRQAFRLLTPGASISSTSRLIELCPDDTFARPGLYLAHARFNASVPASGFEFEALTGTFVSDKPAVIRIRTGDLPFVGRRTVARVRVGEP
jgi:hypothetical protein